MIEGTVLSALKGVIKINSPEWFHILLGCVSSIATGAALPVYSIFFGSILGVLADKNDDYVHSKTNEYCMYLLILGIVVGFASFIQMHTFNIAGEKLTKRVRSRLFRSILYQEQGWFDNKDNGVGALCAKLSMEAAHVQGVSLCEFI